MLSFNFEIFLRHCCCFSASMRLYLWLWFVAWFLSDFHLQLSGTSRSLTEHLLSNVLLCAHHVLEFVSVLGGCKMLEARGKLQITLRNITNFGLKPTISVISDLLKSMGGYFSEIFPLKNLQISQTSQHPV